MQHSHAFVSYIRLSIQFSELTANFRLFQIGTEEEPFQHKGIITMHGQVRAQELPIYGAKTLAVRHGTLELHGRHGNMVHLEYKEIIVTP